MLVEQLVGAELGLVALGLGDALADRGAAGLHVGDADAVAVALDARPVQGSREAHDDPAAAVDLQRLGLQLNRHEVVAGADVQTVAGVQGQAGGLRLARGEV
ncbi:hypothetical protein D3C85_1339210 [compost metagenome]